MRFVVAALAIVSIVGSAVAQHGSEAEDRQQLKDCQAAYQKAQKALARHPKDPTVRRQFVVCTDRYATATMTSLVLGSHEKYPKALRLYREVLKIDPKNREAAANSKMIEDVYRSLGRPIPH